MEAIGTETSWNMLTEVQRETLDFIASFIEAEKRSPYSHEIQAGLGYRSKGSVNRVLGLLEERGAIRRGKYKAIGRLGPGKPAEIEVVQRVAYFKFDDEAKELKMIMPG
jgi:SOS-response transcriptional repressor LexA